MKETEPSKDTMMNYFTWPSLSVKADALFVDEGPKAFCIRWESPQTGLVWYGQGIYTKMEADDLVVDLLSPAYLHTAIWVSLLSSTGTGFSDVGKFRYPWPDHPRTVPVKERNKHERKRNT